MLLYALPSVYERGQVPPAQSRRRVVRLSLAAVVGIAGSMIAAWRDPRDAYPLALIGLVWATLAGMIALVSSRRPMLEGEAGERAALRSLSALPDGYCAVTNAKVSGYERIGDLDIVVVGPCGAVVIEVKNFHQAVSVEGDVWTAHGHGAPRPMRSVTGQLRDQVRALTKSLRRAGLHISTAGIIALNPGSPIQILRSPEFAIVPYDELCRQVLSIPADRGAQQLTQAQTSRLLALLGWRDEPAAEDKGTILE